jgi:hypothetical protein
MKYDIGDVGFEVSTTVFMKIPVFLDVTYSSLKINRRFRAICSRALVAPSFTLVPCVAYFLDPEDGGDMVLRNII